MLDIQFFSLVLPDKKLYLPRILVITYSLIQTITRRKFLILLSRNVIKQTLILLVLKNGERVLILDDSLYSHARSKSVDILDLVHDHTTGHFIRGLPMLDRGWLDCNTFLPQTFSLLNHVKIKESFPKNNQARRFGLYLDVINAETEF